MSTSKHFNRIVAVIAVLGLIVTALFVNGSALGIQSAERSMGYENRIFDTSRVHSIAIVIDDWDAFLESCENEEYAVCSVVIDGESYKNVAIRAKGNTSLSQVKAMDSSRYSFKLEFDHYNDNETYYGLDKLCLNNIIQDNTYMKDYLTYRLMDEFGADAPLCSYAYITVNGEDWGLYLAVESVEDSFLKRSYGSDGGELYKPDSMSMGGGRGNGREFNMEDVFKDVFGEDADISGLSEDEIREKLAEAREESGGDFTGGRGGFPGGRGGGFGQMTPPEGDEMPERPEGGFSGGDFPGGDFPEGDFPEGDFPGGDFPSGDFPSGDFPSGDFPSGDFSSGDFSEGEDAAEDGGRGGFPGGGFPGGMGSGDVKLQYSDDDPDSYSSIFENAKTSVTEADKARLISSLKQLSAQENLDEVLDIDEVLRYFVVHNFVVNGDSYTGSMIHNYYLHESDGKLSMIPWDYNLAFGSFQANNASSAVNDPIDTPLSVGSGDSRPMADWIFASEEYTQLYHELFAEFLDSFDLQAMISETAELIAPYVEKDPTKFCTYEEFEAGVEALKLFCELRCESVKGQLDGSIPSTDEGQSEDSSALVDASGLELSALGSMSMGGGPGGERGGFPGIDSSENGGFPEKPD